jgi:tetratricopeptide (TPR) repeat protein
MNNYFYTKVLGLTIFFFITAIFAFAQCDGYDKFPNGEEAAKKLFEQYQELIVTENFEEAYKVWKSLYEYAPAGNVAHYTDGVYIYKQLMRKATDARSVVLYQSELLRLYDRRMKCFGYPSETENIVLGEKAMEMYYINYDENVTYRTFKYVIETGEMRHSPEFVEVYGTFCNYLYGGDKMDLFHLWESQQQVHAIIDYNINNKTDETVIELYQRAKATVDAYYDIYLNNGDSCIAEVERLKNTYLTSDLDSVRTAVYDTLQSLSCVQAFEAIEELRQSPIGSIEDSDIGKELKQLELESNLSSKTAKKAAFAYDQNQYLLAAELYEQASTETGNNIYKARYAYRIAEIYFHKINSKSEARSFAYQAMNFDPNWGLPYFIIGEMYEASYNDCVEENGVDDQLMVQAAINKWLKAKEIDETVAEKVDAKLDEYKNLIDAKSACDNPKMKTVVLECWINEEVVVEECEE